MDTGWIVRPPLEKIFGVSSNKFEIQVPFKVAKALWKTLEALPIVLSNPERHYRISYQNKGEDSVLLLEPVDNAGGIEGKIYREAGRQYHGISSLGVREEKGKRYGMMKITKGDALEEPAVGVLNILLKYVSKQG